MLRGQLSDWNQTDCDYSREATIAEVIEAQVERTPDRMALIAGDCQLSFQALNDRANQLASHLQDLGVKGDTLVGVALGRSELLVISLLAVLKAGGAYVPLDPKFPQDRVRWMVQDSGMRAVLTGVDVADRLGLNQAGYAMVDVGAFAFESAADVRNVRAIATGENLAYVIYTSGSTGTPKGVMVENRNVVNFFAGMDRAIGADPGVWLAVTSISFDISILELLWTLSRGFTVVLHPDGDFTSIADEVKRYRVTHLQMTPSLARMLTLNAGAYESLGQLKVILLGGEAVPASLIHHLRKVFRGEIFNMYGPTETTIWSTTNKVKEIGTTVSIGKPIANTKVFLLDANLEQVRPGDEGELYIGGEGLARGYWKRPGLTRERFLPIPWEKERRMYRTGDLARINVSGDLEFLGRADYQVKLRGHRIEPGEIEAALEAHFGVRQAVVVMREDREGDARLVAYLVSSGPTAPRVDEIRSSLSGKLPDYMVPSSFVFVQSLALTDNGKIDRKALLKLPPPQSAQAVSSSGVNDAVTSELERVLISAWKEVLNVESIGVNENFFDLGAHSLTVVEVHAKLQNRLNREIPLVDLFQYSSVESLAQHLAGTSSQIRTTDRAQRRRMARNHSA